MIGEEIERKEIEELRERLNMVKLGGGQEAIDRQHAAGKLTARERLEILFDNGIYTELDMFVTHRATEFGMNAKKAYGDGVVTAFGKINNRSVVAIAQDFTFMGGSVGEMHAAKIVKALGYAMSVGVPVVFLNDSGGARIQEGVDSLKGYGDIFYLNVMASGSIPQIAVIMGPCAGGAVYSPALMDFVIMVNKISYMFITGPKVVRAAIGEEVTEMELGGPEIHAAKSGVAHFVADDEREAINIVKKLLSYLPSNSLELPPRVQTGDDPQRTAQLLNSIVPEDASKPYDMRTVIENIVDRKTFFEVQKDFAKNAIIGFARLHGYTIGVVANQPLYYMGALDIDSSDKIAKFVRFCNAFNIPIVTLVDVPGFVPGTLQEYRGIIRHGAKILYAYAEAVVPKLTVIVRKAYGGAYIAMGSRHLGADFVIAWPTAEVAVMGPEAAAEIIWRREIQAVNDESERKIMLQKLAAEYREKLTTPYYAASRGYIDAIVEPSETRPILAKALEFLITKREIRIRPPPKKHGLIPL
ncbi:MAG: acyl-CoA carboxylase subunit beta [Ignisphaera sp.]|nr:acyl-CoA carboxylase subunit beta [Ignisphaera sp.]MCX8167783.1 acyl-CoA carboxylase subunit beta [Ignisphaera sp.]MDW8085230.1 acyl-CoA carboxylase subunit beta [Ignisphaera sp.]